MFSLFSNKITNILKRMQKHNVNLLSTAVMHIVNHLVYFFQVINCALLTRLVVRCENMRSYQTSLVVLSWTINSLTAIFKG